MKFLFLHRGPSIPLSQNTLYGEVEPNTLIQTEGVPIVFVLAPKIPGVKTQKQEGILTGTC